MKWCLLILTFCSALILAAETLPAQTLAKTLRNVDYGFGIKRIVTTTSFSIDGSTSQAFEHELVGPSLTTAWNVPVHRLDEDSYVGVHPEIDITLGFSQIGADNMFNANASLYAIYKMGADGNKYMKEGIGGTFGLGYTFGFVSVDNFESYSNFSALADFSWAISRNTVLKLRYTTSLGSGELTEHSDLFQHGLYFVYIGDYR